MAYGLKASSCHPLKADGRSLIENLYMKTPSSREIQKSSIVRLVRVERF